MEEPVPETMEPVVEEVEDDRSADIEPQQEDEAPPEPTARGDEGEPVAPVQEVFVEGVVEDGFGLLRSDHDDVSDIVKRFTFTNKNGMVVQVINYGVTVTSIRVPDKKGVFDDVMIGFDDFQGYLDNKKHYVGCIVGRVANRVSGAKFLLDNKIYDTTRNFHKGQVHGGFVGFSHVLWKTEVMNDKRVVFSYLSHHHEEGYPGNVLAQVEVWLTDDNGLKMVCTATSDRPTPVNLTNHMYFNLAGHWSGPEAMGEHVLTINADKYLDADENIYPTGEIKHVGTTPFDFRIPRLLSRLIPVAPLGGYDIVYCTNGGKEDGVRFVARLIHPKTGRVMEVFSDQLTLHMYTARNMPKEDQWEELEPASSEDLGQSSTDDDSGEQPPPERKKVEVVGKGGALYLQYGSICMEPQGYSDAVNMPHFPPVILRPGRTYKNTMVYKFSTLVRTKSVRVEAENNTPEPEIVSLHRGYSILSDGNSLSRSRSRSASSSANLSEHYTPHARLSQSSSTESPPRNDVSL